MPPRPSTRHVPDTSDTSLSFEIPTGPSATNLLLDDTHDFLDGVNDDLNATFAPFKSSSPRKPFAPHNPSSLIQQDQELKAPAEQLDPFVEVRRSPRKHKTSSIPSPVRPSSHRKTIVPPLREEEEYVPDNHPIGDSISVAPRQNGARPSVSRPRPSSAYVDYDLPIPPVDSEPAQAPEANLTQSPSITKPHSRSKSATPGRIPVPVSSSRRSSSATPTRNRTRNASSNPVKPLETHAEETISESPTVSLTAHLPETIEEVLSSQPKLKERLPDPPIDDAPTPVAVRFSSPVREAPLRRLSIVRAKSEVPVPQTGLYPSLPQEDRLAQSPSRSKPHSHNSHSRSKSLAPGGGILKPVLSAKPRSSSVTSGHGRTGSLSTKPVARLEAHVEEQAPEVQELSNARSEAEADSDAMASVSEEARTSKLARRGSSVTERFRRYSQKIISSFGIPHPSTPSTLPHTDTASVTGNVAQDADAGSAATEVYVNSALDPAAPVSINSSSKPHELSLALASNLLDDGPLSPLTPPPASPPMHEQALEPEHAIDQAPAPPSPTADEGNMVVMHVPSPAEVSLRTSTKRRAQEDEDAPGDAAHNSKAVWEMEMEMEVDAPASSGAGRVDPHDDVQAPPSVPGEPVAALPADNVSDPPKKRQRVKREHEPRPAVAPVASEAKSDTKRVVGTKVDARPPATKAVVETKSKKPTSTSRAQSRPTKPISASAAATSTTVVPRSRAPQSQGSTRTEARRTVPISASSAGTKPLSKQKPSRVEPVKKLAAPATEVVLTSSSMPALTVIPTAEAAPTSMTPSNSAPALHAAVQQPETSKAHPESEGEQGRIVESAMDADVVASSEGHSDDPAETEAPTPVSSDDPATAPAPTAGVATGPEERPAKRAKTSRSVAPTARPGPGPRISLVKAEKAAAAADKAKVRARAKVHAKSTSLSEKPKPKSGPVGLQPATVPTEFTFRMDSKTNTYGRGAAGGDASAKTDSDLNANNAAASGSRSDPSRPRAPIPDFKALQASHAASLAAKRPTVVPVFPVAAPNLKTVSRAKEREKFDTLVRAHEEERKREKEEEQRKREEEAEREVREMRKRAVPKANEVPEWYANMPKREREKGKEKETD